MFTKFKNTSVQITTEENSTTKNFLWDGFELSEGIIEDLEFQNKKCELEIMSTLTRNVHHTPSLDLKHIPFLISNLLGNRGVIKDYGTDSLQFKGSKSQKGIQTVINNISKILYRTIDDPYQGDGRKIFDKINKMRERTKLTENVYLKSYSNGSRHFLFCSIFLFDFVFMILCEP